MRERESGRAGGYSLIPGICINAFFHGAYGFVSLADFVAFYSHRKSLRMDLFWQPQFRKQKVRRGEAMSGLHEPRVVTGSAAAALCTQ
jgi:hypothetical protein